jgi:hypothetical protein
MTGRFPARANKVAKVLAAGPPPKMAIVFIFPGCIYQFMPLITLRRQRKPQKWGVGVAERWSGAEDCNGAKKRSVGYGRIWSDADGGVIHR